MLAMAEFCRDHLFDVTGLVVAITGASSGIGLLMAKALEANGAKVYIIGRRLDRLDAAAKEAVHGNLIPLQGDVTSKDDLLRVAGSISSNTGYINLLIANAGIPEPSPPSNLSTKSIAEVQDALWKTDADAFANVLNTNFSATYFTCVTFLDLLDAGNKAENIKQHSQIITTSSITAFNRRVTSGFAYGASKAAVTHLTKQLATFLAPYAIRCNVFAPGIFPSEMLDQSRFGGMIDGSVIPEGRTGDSEDIAGAVLFMASRAGAYCNGNVMVLDGGRLSVTPSSY